MLSSGGILLKYNNALLNGATLKFRSKRAPEHDIVSLELVTTVKSFSIEKARYFTEDS